MRKSLYGISMVAYVISIITALVWDFSVFFMGYHLIASFSGSDKYGKILTIVLTVIAMLFHTLAMFKSKKYICVTRGILFLGILFNILWLFISIDMALAAVIPTILLIFTFIEKTEYVITDTLTEEELAEIEKENKENKLNSVFGNIVSFFILPIVLSVVIVICAAPFALEVNNDLKEEYRKDLPAEMATEEQCNEFLENINNYEELGGNWYLDTLKVTKMLKSDSNSDDYWTVGDNLDIVYHLFYDDWDNVADDYTLIKKDYKFPDTETAKVSKICFAANFANGYRKEDAVIIDLTEKEIEEIRYFIMEQNYDEGKTQYYDKEYYESERKLDILWYFEGEDALYYEYGEIIKTADGKYHLRAAPSYYTVYTLPDDICERLEKTW
ncbi:MAG: hypothetical protein IKU66_03715 [Clostridia bacterium]|nr:hypothetical protein [Clostridia bacterium]